jgi:hypothetical protein
MRLRSQTYTPLNAVFQLVCRGILNSNVFSAHFAAVGKVSYSSQTVCSPALSLYRPAMPLLC